MRQKIFAYFLETEQGLRNTLAEFLTFEHLYNKKGHSCCRILGLV